MITNLDSTLKSRDITLPTKGHLVKAMVFPVVMYGCESWQEYTEELHKTDLYDPDNHSGVITHLDSSWNVKSSGP